MINWPFFVFFVKFLACLLCPSFLDESSYPQDIKEKARRILQATRQFSIGALDFSYFFVLLPFQLFFRLNASYQHPNRPRGGHWVWRKGVTKGFRAWAEEPRAWKISSRLFSRPKSLTPVSRSGDSLSLQMTRHYSGLYNYYWLDVCFYGPK